jgi:hypothetical protein
MSLDWVAQMLVVFARSFIQHRADKFLIQSSNATLHRVSFPIVGLISSCSSAYQPRSFSF